MDSTYAAELHAASLRLREAGVEDDRLEAEVLLADAFVCEGEASRAGRRTVLACLMDEPSEAVLARFEERLARRLRREPLAYITGRREFYGIDIQCAPPALIPRPESEMLVDIALQEVRARGDNVRLADVGTGSGAIAIAIAMHAPGQKVTATDTSSGALGLAYRNAALRGVADQISFVRTDLLGGLGAFDVIVANLPYVSEAESETLQPEVRDFEPRPALVGGVRGTETIERFLEGGSHHLSPGGICAIEIGAMQGKPLQDKAERVFPKASVYVIKDLSGHDRVLVVRLPGSEGQ